MAKTISRKEFYEFLVSKGNGVYTCPYCAAQAFAVNIDAEGKELNPDGTTSDKESPPAHLEMPVATGGNHNFFSISCTNCGFTTFFHMNQIEAWLGVHGKEDAGG